VCVLYSSLLKLNQRYNLIILDFLMFYNKSTQYYFVFLLDKFIHWVFAVILVLSTFRNFLLKSTCKMIKLFKTHLEGVLHSPSIYLNHFEGFIILTCFLFFLYYGIDLDSINSLSLSLSICFCTDCISPLRNSSFLNIFWIIIWEYTNIVGFLIIYR